MPLPHAKLTWLSFRCRTEILRSISSKYSPVSPVPVPVIGVGLAVGVIDGVRVIVGVAVMVGVFVGVLVGVGLGVGNAAG